MNTSWAAEAQSALDCKGWARSWQRDCTAHQLLLVSKQRERDRMPKPSNIPLSKVLVAARELSTGQSLDCPASLPAGIFIGDCFQPHELPDQWAVAGWWRGEPRLSSAAKDKLKLSWETRLGVLWALFYEVALRTIHWFLEACCTSSSLFYM